MACHLVPLPHLSIFCLTHPSFSSSSPGLILLSPVSLYTPLANSRWHHGERHARRRAVAAARHLLCFWLPHTPAFLFSDLLACLFFDFFVFFLLGTDLPFCMSCHLVSNLLASSLLWVIPLCTSFCTPLPFPAFGHLFPGSAHPSSYKSQGTGSREQMTATVSQGPTMCHCTKQQEHSSEQSRPASPSSGAPLHSGGRQTVGEINKGGRKQGQKWRRGSECRVRVSCP